MNKADFFLNGYHFSCFQIFTFINNNAYVFKLFSDKIPQHIFLKVELLDQGYGHFRLIYTTITLLELLHSHSLG